MYSLNKVSVSTRKSHNNLLNEHCCWSGLHPFSVCRRLEVKISPWRLPSLPEGPRGWSSWFSPASHPQADGRIVSQTSQRLWRVLSSGLWRRVLLLLESSHESQLEPVTNTDCLTDHRSQRDFVKESIGWSARNVLSSVLHDKVQVQVLVCLATDP
jgi:hypothetical protein